MTGRDTRNTRFTQDFQFALTAITVCLSPLRVYELPVLSTLCETVCGATYLKTYLEKCRVGRRGCDGCSAGSLAAPLAGDFPRDKGGGVHICRLAWVRSLSLAGCVSSRTEKSTSFVRDGGIVALPQLTDEQRAAALAKAAAARRARAELKEKLKKGGTNLKQVLTDAETDEVLGKMKVSALLEALPKVGKVKAQEIMTELEIAPTRRLRGLGDRQRKALLERFDFS
ncbi:MIHF [Mycobacteroides abscessus subsp. abscessus]|nr:MIHF [Mycobacteroides abscessus subsp. abscessus]